MEITLQFKEDEDGTYRCLDGPVEAIQITEWSDSRGASKARPENGTLHICPVCHGKGFLPGNFYELPGQSVSYAGYMNLASSSVVCRSCQSKGFVEL